jgi:hypothetical protein
MDESELTVGEGRTQVNLRAPYMGEELVIFVYNENAHVGAIAVGEYDPKEKRASTSVITRLGHKDDIVAQKAAYSISKSTKKPVCVIAGIHVDNITDMEINQILQNTNALVSKFIVKRREEEGKARGGNM